MKNDRRLLNTEACRIWLDYQPRKSSSRACLPRLSRPDQTLNNGVSWRNLREFHGFGQEVVFYSPWIAT